MGKICVECEDPSWTGQDPIVAPELPSDGGGVKVVDELPEKGQKGMAYVLVDDLDNPTSSQGIFVYDEGWLLTAQPVSEAVQMVEELPEEGQPGVLYYVPKTGDDTYDLYRWMNNDWVKVDTDIKLYAATGQNTDGAMTQAATTQALADNRGLPKVMSADDYNYPTNNPTSVALWKLPTGTYYFPNGIKHKHCDIGQEDSNPDLVVVMQHDKYAECVLIYEYREYAMSGYQGAGFLTITNTYGAAGTNNQLPILTSKSVIDELTSGSTTKPLSAKQGRILNGKIGDLSTLTTTDKTSAVAAINELVASGGSVSYYSNSELESLWEGGA